MDYAAIDLGSTNGTFVNDHPNRPAAALADGDYLRVGNCIYRFPGRRPTSRRSTTREIYRLAIIDGLTDVPNKRYLMEFPRTRTVAFGAAQSPRWECCWFDIDRFKVINDDPAAISAATTSLRGNWPGLLAQRDSRRGTAGRATAGEEFVVRAAPNARRRTRRNRGRTP